jgi:prepilin-type N-terminal cleavage/methylation domain-containing protein
MRVSKSQSRRHLLASERGMTLIEIMIVIAIIAGLMAVLGSSAVGFLNKRSARPSKPTISLATATPRPIKASALS